MKYFITIVTLCFIGINLYAQAPKIKWTSVGIGGGGGQFTPSISPLDSKIMFVSCDMGGIYRTTNAGESWSMINFRQLKSSISVGTVFHPSNKDIMWDDDGRILKKTSDGGLTWVDSWQMPANADALFIPSNADELKIFAAFENQGLFVSSDGENFEHVEGIDKPLYICGDKDIVVASKDKIWLSDDLGTTFNPIAGLPKFETPYGISGIASAENNIYVLEQTKLWKTTDRGSHWKEIAKNSDYDRGVFKFVRAAGNYVWITTGGGKYQPTALLSTDMGENFKPVFFCNDSWDDTRNLENGWLSLDFSCGWGGAAIGFNISPTNPNIALWTDYGRTLMTTNAGETWEAVYTKYADEGKRDKGKLWSSRGLEVTSSWDIYIPRNDNSFINIAYTDIGGTYSHDGGNSWRSNFDAGIPSKWHNTTYDFVYDPENETLWGAFSGRHDIPGGWSANYWKNEGLGGVAFSTDSGMHWTPLTDNGLIEKPVTSIAIDFTSPANQRRLYAAVWSDGVWRSDDGGKNWERISDGLDCGDGSQSNDGPNTHVVDVQVNSAGVVYVLKTKYLRDNYVIKNDAGLWRSTNHGDSWEFISETVPECPPRPNIDLKGEHSWSDAISFTLDENNPNHIFVGAQNATNGKIQGGLYETTDGGKNWKRIHQNYASFRVTISKYHKNRLYLTGSGEGILISEDKGTTWNIVENFPFAHPTRVTEDPLDENVIWVNTFGGGVWKGELLNQTAVSNNQSDLMRIFPNPATDYIEITIPPLERGLGGVSVKVYDLLGVEVLRQNSDSRFRGNDRQVLRLDVSALPAGVYFVCVGDKTYKFVKM